MTRPMPRDESRLTWQQELEESAGNKHPSPRTLKSAAEANQQLLTMARQSCSCRCQRRSFIKSAKHETNADLECTVHQNPTVDWPYSLFWRINFSNKKLRCVQNRSCIKT